MVIFLKMTSFHIGLQNKLKNKSFENSILVHFGPLTIFLKLRLNVKDLELRFCDQLNELFQMTSNIFSNKNQILKSYFGVPYAVT